MMAMQVVASLRRANRAAGLDRAGAKRNKNENWRAGQWTRYHAYVCMFLHGCSADRPMKAMSPASVWYSGESFETYW